MLGSEHNDEFFVNEAWGDKDEDKQVEDGSRKCTNCNHWGKSQ